MGTRLLMALIALASLTASCAAPPKTWRSTPPIQDTVNSRFSVSLEPLRKGGAYFNVFRVTVRNDTDADMEIDWNKSRYTHDGRAISGFAFQGVAPEDLKEGTIPPDVVPARSSLQKDLVPVKLIAFKPLRDRSLSDSGFSGGMIPPGDNGVLLVIRQKGEETPQGISVRITEEGR